MTLRDLENVRAELAILAHVARQKKQLKQLEDQAKPVVLEALGDATDGVLDGELVIQRKTHKRSSLDQKALRAEEPEIAALYTKTTEVTRTELVGVDGDDDE